MLVMEGGGFMFPAKPAKARRNGPGGAGPYSTLDGEPKANATDGWKEVGRDLPWTRTLWVWPKKLGWTRF